MVECMVLQIVHGSRLPMQPDSEYCPVQGFIQDFELGGGDDHKLWGNME